MEDHSIAADASLITGLGFFSLSLAELHMLLQIIALVLGIFATSITIAVHLKRWLSKVRSR